MLRDKLDCAVRNYKTDYHVFRVGVQLGDFNRNLADTSHTEKHFQCDCEERLGNRYVVQIFHNIFRCSHVPVHSFPRKSGKEQGIGGRIWNDVFGICRQRILDVELTITNFRYARAVTMITFRWPSF